jgi:membrane-associated protease RseP (regulator of RpoE activity)
MGHYVACRYYRVDATLPFFIPSPWFPVGVGLWIPLSFVGTFGAVIRIRGPIPHRRALFDIGIAGPLAGFVVCLGVLALATSEMTLAPNPTAGDGILLGDPLLLQWAARLALGIVPEDRTLTIGPLGLAAWFGMFVTALNLIPIGQLDGGHVTYSLFREKAYLISRIGWWACVALIYVSPSWILWAILIRLLGRRHPPTLDDYAPIDRGRALVALGGLAVFVVCFVPSPVLGSWDAVLDLLGY